MNQSSVSHILSWPWAIAVILGCALAACLIVAVMSRRGSRRRADASAKLGAADAIWVANSSYVRDLPEFKRQLRKYRLFQALGALSLTVALVGGSFLVARPVTVTVSDPRMANRDIVLCLDISGSMLSYDRELVNVFSTLVDSFVGERIALSIFNTTSRTVFPLTDDYGMVKEQLSEAYDALHPRALTGNPQALAKYEYFTAGANANLGVGSSLIGDGLASCALQFETADTGLSGSDGEPRSRSIIFATDNDLEGEPVYSLKDAADLASELDISLIGIYGSGSTDLAGEEEFDQVFTEAGGMYFYSNDPIMIDSIVTDIQSRQAVEHDAAPVITRTNTVGPWLIVMIAGFAGFLAVAWRLGE